MRQLGVRDPLSLPEPQALQLPLAQVPGPLLLGDRCQRLPDLAVAAGEKVAVPIGEHEELAEVALRLRTAADPEEVDDLDEEPGPPLARALHGTDQFGETGDEPVVADPKQRSAGNVA